jgi:LPXTG-motif cell wall-anchored protein
VNGAQTLPRTASELPLLVALGLLALAGALTARTFAKRSV